MIIDTHCHLHFEQFDADRQAMLSRAREWGVQYMINVGTDPNTNRAAFELSDQYEYMFHTAGLHPHHSHEVPESEIGEIDAFVRDTRPVAIGEIGLDYYKSEADPETQKRVFSKMLRIAMRHGLPVVVHSRDAFRDTMDVLRDVTGGKIHGVMHCFSYGLEEFKELTKFGFYAGFTANITYKNAGPLLAVAKTAPLDRFVLETDSPYLAPQIHRGKRNEPANLSHLAEFLARERAIEKSEVEIHTSENAIRLFNLDVEHV